MMVRSVVVVQLLLIGAATRSESSCSSGCDLALASYYISPNLNLTYISGLFGRTYEEVLPFNKDSITNKDSVQAGSRVNINFPCDCINDDFLGRTFPYTTLSSDTYDKIATTTFANLTTAAWLATVNTYPPTRIPDGVTINVTINCSCGDSNVSPDYGLFLTYPLRPEVNLSSLTADLGLPSSDQALLQSYNPGVSFNAGKGIVFVPTKDSTGSYHPLPSSSGGIARGAIAGISVAGAVLLVAAICLYLWIYKRKKQKMALPNLSLFEDNSIQHDHGTTTASDKTSVLTPRAGGASPLTGITVYKSMEFSYEELSKATNDFSLANKIGEGSFGAVYYAELRGEKAAIKKMDMQASKEFLAELKVLTHVHHLNLVRLIGYCTEESLFLVYEYIENGNLSEHLRGSGRDPLLWSDRVQIALDSARGLEYIHEQTVPVYIHRDIKSANILIDKNFHAKVADFGLTKLTEVGSSSLPTCIAGTFGYMPPEYAYGDVSPKADVYAFGVVLYELISAKAALFKSNKTDTESKRLVALFEETLNQPDPKEDLRKLVDPRLGDNQLVDSIHKMAQLAKACTQETPQLRPSMRSIVVELMTLSSTTEDWDEGSHTLFFSSIDWLV